MPDKELNLPLHPHPAQEEMPFAVVQGAPWTTIPKDLYIPPDALEVFLDAFEGPLDLLLYLIKRQNLDILDIPIAQITSQYMEYVDLMKDIRLELAAEYLVMAAMLAEIKSRMLLPRQEELEDEEGDPRAELIRRLQEYERYKQAAEDIDNLPRMGRDLFQAEAEVPDRIIQRRPPDVDLREILFALKEVMHRVDMFSHHHVQMEALSVREKMSGILERINAESFTEFTQLFDPTEGRLGVVVTFLAVLELIKGALIDLIQAESFGPIHVKAVSKAEH
ncbi:MULTISPECIES: ScpA family protein [Sedimenticola]|uniref:segregation and condensation protein A n=1 Tax=Sedimenticola TaxID=349742 RepID=UPI0004BB2D12|nr:MULTISPECIES: ScpA family protein [Sedimenticola]MCW8903663.1 segregation/condensation protein A [Sedimenticola sp.]